MTELKFIAKKGLEKFYDVAVLEKEQFEAELEVAKRKAIEEIESRFAEKKTIINEIFEKVVDIIEVEKPDEVQEFSSTSANAVNDEMNLEETLIN